MAFPEKAKKLSCKDTLRDKPAFIRDNNYNHSQGSMQKPRRWKAKNCSPFKKGGCAMANIGKNIRKLRTACNMTQDTLSEKLFVSRQTVSNYENGRSNPDIDTLTKLAEIFETDVNALIYGPAPAPNKSGSIPRLCVAAGAAFALCIASYCLLPLADRFRSHYYSAGFSYLLRTGLLPAAFLLWGWCGVFALEIFCGAKPLSQKHTPAWHKTLVAALLLYFLLTALYLLPLLCSSIGILWSAGHGQSFSFHMEALQIPILEDILWDLNAFVYKYNVIFLIPGALLKLTGKPALPPVSPHGENPSPS